MSDSVPPIELPACELGRLEEISELVSMHIIIGNSFPVETTRFYPTFKILPSYTIHTYHDTFIG